MRTDVKILLVFAVLFAGGGLFLFFTQQRDFTFDPSLVLNASQEVASLEPIIEPPKSEPDPNADIPSQKPLENPPEVIRAIYATGWSAGSLKRMDYLINLIKNTELNAIIIDIKDYSGTISYDTDIELVDKYGAEEVKIQRPNALIKKLHDEGIYVIARQTIFQDPVLAKARPDLALTSSSTGKQWKDKSGLMWMDPAGQEVWDYNVLIAQDAVSRGFDEINFDYIRFISDGDLDDAVYPYWDFATASRRQVIRDFFRYLRQAMPSARLSVDLFGLTTINYDDRAGIGQIIDDAYHFFDAVAPMVYPSHYNKGFNNFDNPAVHPYEIVYASILVANERLQHYIINAETSTSTQWYLVKKPQLRPWLQDFDLGAIYDAEKVRAQIDATYAAASGTPIGWMLWDPSNTYTKDALLTNN